MVTKRIDRTFAVSTLLLVTQKISYISKIKLWNPLILNNLNNDSIQENVKLLIKILLKNLNWFVATLRT